MTHVRDRIRFDAQGHIVALDLSGLSLVALPPAIGQLTHLKTLSLAKNLLQAFPLEIRGLTQLEDLDLSENRLAALSPDIGRLRNLRSLRLWGNRLKEVPLEIGLLTSLESLDLSVNELRVLPSEIGQLKDLESLYLFDNRLTVLPRDICRLTELQSLFLWDNHLTALPDEIGQLANLQELDISRNHLTALPPEIATLTDLQSLVLESNPLRTPPPEIVSRGQSEVFDFLTDLAQGCVTRHEAKLLMVGEGGTGKSSLLRALRDEPFVEGLPSTHGVDIRLFKLPHPHQPGETITLNVWDFGGQQIYHTTHQFFMTKRSLYLLVWNARGDVDQARLDHWLRNIRVHAPEAPVILVATHIDERPADLNYHRFREAYPQLVGHLGVSNRDRRGIADLQGLIAREAARLPLMEQQWPRTWVAAEDQLRQLPSYHLNLAEYTHICGEQGVGEEIAETAFGGYLHDLGKILYYQDDHTLSDFVILKPNWLTRAISRILDDERTREQGGVLAHTDFPRIWDRDENGQPYERRLYPLFLRLMERYLISVPLENNTLGQRASHSLVPLLLPHDPPPSLSPWSEVLADQPEINMVFRMHHFIPPGLMSWFIALTHRYTQDLRWREGVRLTYQDHQAQAILNPSKRELWLRVRGPAPSNFFNILQHTINDRILEYYFEGLEYTREVPCNCHLTRGDDQPCPYFHDYERLAERMKLGKLTAECGVSFTEVSVPLLLEGIHFSTDEQVAARLEETQQALQALTAGQNQIIKITSQNRELLIQNGQMFEQLNRSFSRLWNLQMASLNAECPNVFIFMPGDRALFDPRNLFSTEYTLYLLCQNPAGPHMVPGEKGYPVPQAKEWWTDLAPWLNRLVEVLRYIPKARAVAEAYDEGFIRDIKTSLDIFEAALGHQSTIKPAADAERLSLSRSRFEPFAAEGPALRALHTFLKRVDEHARWCGLHRTATSDGNIFWLCDFHQRLYEAL